MEKDSLKALVESLLFVADGPVDLARLERTLETDRATIEGALEALANDSQNRGVRLQRKGDAVQMVAAPESAPHVERFLGIGPSEKDGKLSVAALETLAAVAYLQPVTRARIEAIRGVNSDRAIATLQARGLVEEVGRMETVGHPALFGTTFEFLQHFGFMSLDELPPLDGKIPSLKAEPEKVASVVGSDSAETGNGEDS